MSETPRTDEVMRQFTINIKQCPEFRLGKLAQQLERQLAEARAELADLKRKVAEAVFIECMNPWSGTVDYDINTSCSTDLVALGITPALIRDSQKNPSKEAK